MSVSRRGFLGMAASAGAMGLSGCATGAVPGIASGRSANGRLRLAAIGCGGQGKSDISRFAAFKRMEFAAFCDVDLKMLEPLKAMYPKARFYQNYRELLEREDVDAALVATPDHSHCEIMSEVLRRRINLYAQKPLCRSFAENRQLERLAADAGVVTQLGAQCAPWECDRHTAALISRGRIGRVKHVWLFSNSGYYAKMLKRAWPLETAPVPETLDWKGWLAGAPYRPYSPKAYHAFTWRVWRDFGSGWLGDMGSHLMQPIWIGMKLGRRTPLAAKAEVFDCGWSAEFKRQFLPLYTHVTWNFGEFEVEWCDGPRDGSLPKEFIADGKVGELEKVKLDMSVPAQYLPPARFLEMAKGTPLWKLPLQGRVVEGTDGWLISTHYNKPPVMLDRNLKPLPLELPVLEPVGSHYEDFAGCCLDGGVPAADLSWSCKLTDWLLLGRKAIDNPGQEIRMA